jgi:hypothetical protein
MTTPTLTVVPPVPVVVLAFHSGLPGEEKVTPIEVEIVAEEPPARRGDRLFIGGVKEAASWLARRGYHWVPASNAKWAA